MVGRTLPVPNRQLDLARFRVRPFRKTGSARLADKRQLRTCLWIRNRLAWLSTLNGTPADDADHMRRNV